MDQKGGVSSEKNGEFQTLRSVQGQSRKEKQQDNASIADSIKKHLANNRSSSTVDQAGDAPGAKPSGDAPGAKPPGLGGINPPAKD